MTLTDILLLIVIFLLLLFFLSLPVVAYRSRIRAEAERKAQLAHRAREEKINVSQEDLDRAGGMQLDTQPELDREYRPVDAGQDILITTAAPEKKNGRHHD